MRDATWREFAVHPERAPTLIEIWRLVEAPDGVTPALALRLIAHHLASPWTTFPWPHLLDPLLAIPGIVDAWRGSGDPRLGLGLALAGLIDAGEIGPAMIDAYVDAVAAMIEGDGDAIAGACDDGARLCGRDGFAARLAASIPSEARLPPALCAWLVRDEPDAARRVRVKLRAAELDGPRPLAIAEDERATFAALLADPHSLADDDALAAGIAARLLDLGLPIATWDALVRTAHLAHTEDHDEPAIDVVRALRAVSAARRAALMAEVPAFPWSIASPLTSAPAAIPRPLGALVDEAWHRLHADALACVPRSYVTRILDALDAGAAGAAVADASIEHVGCANRRARIARLIELRAPEVVIAPELERLRASERRTRGAAEAAMGVSTADPRARGRGLRLLIAVGERLLPRWRRAFPDDDLAIVLLEDLTRLARGEPRQHAERGARAQDEDRPDPAWSIALFLFAAAEHADGLPTLTLQDTPLDLAQQALMPEGFGSPAGADDRRGFWRWWLTEAIPAAW